MNLNDFIENADELGVVALESNELKEINGGIGGPAAGSSAFRNYLRSAEYAYLTQYYEEVYG